MRIRKARAFNQYFVSHVSEMILKIFRENFYIESKKDYEVIQQNIKCIKFR